MTIGAASGLENRAIRTDDGGRWLDIDAAADPGSSSDGSS
jgi:hypothetical protein